MHKSKARELIDLLSKSQQVAVHDNGEVSINNKTLPQSNIVRLVHDVLRDLPKMVGPLGHKNLYPCCMI